MGYRSLNLRLRSLFLNYVTRYDAHYKVILPNRSQIMNSLNRERSLRAAAANQADSRIARFTELRQSLVSCVDNSNREY